MILIGFLFIAGLLAWAMGTVAAGGAATIMIPIMGLLVGIETTIPAIALASLLANPGRAFMFRHYIDWRIARWLIPGTIIGGLLGGYSFAILPEAWLQISIGFFLLLLATPLKGIAPSLKWPIQAFMPLGFVVSFLSGLVGGSGPILNPFFLRYGSRKEAIVATKSLNSLLMQLAKLLIYGFTGVLSGMVWQCGLAVGLGAIIGTAIGKRHLLAINEKRFQIYTAVLMSSAGLIILYKGISSLFSPAV